MSKSHIIFTILVLLNQAGMLSAGQTYTNLVETTYDDPNWVIVTSDVDLRENICEQYTYENVFNPCYGYNRYWKLAAYAKSGCAFPISQIKIGTVDSLYVREGFGFQIYDNTDEPDDLNDLVPYGPYMSGPKYVGIDRWREDTRYEQEPGTFFVHGDKFGPAGDLENYSIIIYANPLGLSKTDDVNDANCVYPDNIITYEISYENRLFGPNDPSFVLLRRTCTHCCHGSREIVLTAIMCNLDPVK